MKAREFIPTEKPRNFVAKNAKMGGAGQHKDKKKAEKQGDLKHKNKQFEEGVNHSALQGWDEMSASQKRLSLDAAGVMSTYDSAFKSSSQLDDILHAAKVKAQNQEDELSIGAGGRRELQRQAKQDFEEQRQQLHKEKMEMERFAWEKTNTETERKHEMAKIEKEYLHDLRKLQMGHQQDMEKILHADTHELNKMKAEFNMRQAEREKDKPEEPESKPDDEDENNYDQDTGEPLKPGFSKPQQSNQWHTSQQVGYKPTKPSKDNDDDIIDVEPKPNKPLRIKEKISIVNDPEKATGIQRTGGITHGSIYAGNPQQSQSSQQSAPLRKRRDEAVDSKGRTQQQWMKLVKEKFPGSRIMQSKMVDGPCFATTPDGRKLSWNKVEKGVADEGVFSFLKAEPAPKKKWDPAKDSRVASNYKNNDNAWIKLLLDKHRRGIPLTDREWNSIEQWKLKRSMSGESTEIQELSTDKLAQYKKAAGADAKKADADGDYARGDKRFKGINKATNKQFNNDLKKHGQKDVAERARDPEDWDEGNTEPANNFAVYINGKKWKVFKGRGRYADDNREQAHYQQLKDWAAKKSADTGKKWTVSITGETATE